MKKKHTILKIAIGLIILITLFYSLVTFITDFLWFKELGYLQVFFTKLFTVLKIGIPAFVIITLFAYIYLKLLKASYFKKVGTTDFVGGKKLNIATWILSGLFGAGSTYILVSELWFQILQFSNSTSFGKKDPLFNNDISLYVFKLAFINGITGILLGILIAFIVLTIAYYFILFYFRKPDFFTDDDSDYYQETHDQNEYEPFSRSGSMNDNKRWGDKFSEFKRQFAQANGIDFNARKKKKINKSGIWEVIELGKTRLAVVGCILFLLIGVRYFLKSYDLLHAHTGAVYGAGFTDVHITLWVYRILMCLSVVAAVTFILGIEKKKLKMIVVVPVAMICIGIVGAITGTLVQNLVVSPNEIAKEGKYLQSNMDCTKDAYGLNDVSVKSFSATSDLTSKDIIKNEETIKNIRINDYEPAEKFYNQTQSIRQYYQFNNVDVDRYVIDGELTQTFLSAREIDETKINTAWLTKHLKYTHGYGFTLSRVNEITSSGQPKMLVSNIPAETDKKALQVKRPETYFGELTNDYVIVDTDEDEFDYPDGDSNKYNRYDGNAGIKMNFFNRILFAIREKSLKILVASNISSKSKILINRNIETRVNRIMPYLSYEQDPYMIVVDGNLYWMIDAYTTSSQYPYSEPYDAAVSTSNYIRNSVKVVVDAYNGDTNYYIVDDTDPIAETYRKIFPKLFKDAKEMPEGVKKHIRYPHTMFNVQARVYEHYHMNDVKVFYQKEDVWSVANEIYGTKEQEMSSQYYVMSLPGKKKTEFVNLIPYTPKDKKNMTGLMVARNDGDNYGKLVLYKLPKNKVVYGPIQIEAQIDQNTEISKEFSLWSSNGSDYSRGNMFVIPIEDSILYVEPVYLEAKNSSIPEVKRVIVAYNDQIAYEPTLAEALNSLFGPGSANEDPSDEKGEKNNKTMSQSEIVLKAQAAFDKAEKAQRSGNWAEYGKQMDLVRKYLGMLK